jgi:hypothetical protein
MNRRLALLTLATIGCGSAAEEPGGLPPATGGPVGGGNINIGADAGASAGSGADAGASFGASNRNNPADAGGTHTAQGREYGVGDYAVILTSAAAPPRLCWYTEVTTRVCDGNPPTKRVSADQLCVDGGQNCLANQPSDSKMDNGSCTTWIDFDTVGSGALTGDCATLAAYRLNYLSGACMFHKHCPGGKCVDYQCTGANYHLPSAPGPGPGASPDASPSGTMDPGPMRGGSPDAGTSSPDTRPMPDPTPAPTPPDASPPQPPPGPPGGPPPPPGP